MSPDALANVCRLAAAWAFEKPRLSERLILDLARKIVMERRAALEIGIERAPRLVLVKGGK